MPNDPRQQEHVETIGEMLGIGAGQAAAVLGEMMDAPIHRELPVTDIWKPGHALAGLRRALGEQVHQAGFRFEGITHGRAWIFMAPETTAQFVAQALGDDEPADEETNASVLEEIANIMLSRVVGEFANQMGVDINHREPAFSTELARNPMFVGTEPMAFFRARMRLAPEGGTRSGELLLVVSCSVPEVVQGELDALESEDPKTRFLLPGEYALSQKPGLWSTLLGSCVSVCLRNRRTGAAGMNHYLLSHANDRQPPGRYGDTALAILWRQLRQWDPNPRNYEARIYGGAKMFERADSFRIGEANVAYARAALTSLGIAITEEQVAGNLGKHILFDTERNTVTWRDCSVDGRNPKRAA